VQKGQRVTEGQVIGYSGGVPGANGSDIPKVNIFMSDFLLRKVWK